MIVDTILAKIFGAKTEREIKSMLASRSPMRPSGTPNDSAAPT